MRRLIGGCLLACLWLGGVLSCPGQLTDSLGRLNVELPKPPPSHVLDVAGLFDRHPEELAEISGMLKSLEAKHGVPVYLAVYAGLLRGGVREQSKVLFDTWIGDGGDGLVVVCDTDSRKLDVGMPLASFQELENGEVIVSRLPDEEVIPILLELKEKLAGREDGVDYLVELTAHLTTRLDGMLSVERSTGPDKAAWIIVGITLLAVGVLGLLGWVASRWMRGSDVKAAEQFFFPDVLVGVRLGAQCGGGRVAVRHFGAGRKAGERLPADDR